MKKYKIGDKVKIKDLRKIKNNDGIVNIVSDMLQYSGQIFTIDIKPTGL